MVDHSEKELADFRRKLVIVQNFSAHPGDHPEDRSSEAKDAPSYRQGWIDAIHALLDRINGPTAYRQESGEAEIPDFLKRQVGLLPPASMPEWRDDDGREGRREGAEEDPINWKAEWEATSLLRIKDAAEIERLRAMIENPPKHNYWRPGELDCPKDILAGNGELHTLRCKACGLDDPRNQTCFAGRVPRQDREGGGWRAIESAPRDGTPILIYFAKRTGRLEGAYRVEWHNLHGETTPEDGSWCVDDEKFGPYALRGWCSGDEVGWQPLPAAPTPIHPQGEEQ